jgi:hypothetical protein
MSIREAVSGLRAEPCMGASGYARHGQPGLSAILARVNMRSQFMDSGVLTMCASEAS